MLIKFFSRLVQKVYKNESFIEFNRLSKAKFHAESAFKNLFDQKSKEIAKFALFRVKFAVK